MTLNQLRKLNKHITIKGIVNKSFIKYGRIITRYNFVDLIKYVEEKTPVSEEGVVEVSQVKSLEKLKVSELLKSNFFGEMDIQLGYCNGNNNKLNYLQYHKSSKIIIAVTDIIIFLGRVQDIKDNQYEAKKAEAFFIPEGVAFEVYGTTIHSLPCNMEKRGFKTVLVLPKGTNLQLSDNKQEETLLHSRNRWIIAHEEAKHFTNDDGQIGIAGENLEIFLTKQ